MEKKNKLFEHVMREMNAYEKLIKESYAFDEDSASYDENEMVDEYPEERYNETMKTDDKISQIRAIALEGIQAYADDVDSEEYDFFKKIWLMCDKVCSEKETSKDENI